MPEATALFEYLQNVDLDDEGANDSFREPDQLLFRACRYARCMWLKLLRFMGNETS